MFGWFQPSQGLGLAREALREPGLGLGVGRDHLEGDLALELLLPRPVDVSHASPPQQLEQLEVGQVPRDLLPRLPLLLGRPSRGIGVGRLVPQCGPKEPLGLQTFDVLMFVGHVKRLHPVMKEAPMEVT